MLENTSVLLKGTESFQEAFDLLKSNEPNIRYLKTPEGKATGVYQVQYANSDTWGGPRMLKRDKEGNFINLVADSKKKLANTELLYSTFNKPTHAGQDNNNSWLIGNIENLQIANEDYNVQGLIISSIFDPTPKFYLSFQRLVCENQFGSLGTSNSSFYIDMNKLLHQPVTMEAKEQLQTAIAEEIQNRYLMQLEAVEKLKRIKLSEDKIDDMFQKLTIDKIAKNSPKYEDQVKRLDFYRSKYDCDDNQNYKGTFMGFVNTCTNVNSRQEDNPIKLVKPLISPNILKQPCNLEYLFRDVLVHAA